MSAEVAVLLFIGNAVLFWLWSSHLLPLISGPRAPRGPCPHCGQ